MAYRGETAPGARCYRHDAAPASASCARCLNAICDICLVYERTLPHCPGCARRARRMRSLARALSFGAVLLAVAGAATFLVTRKHAFDYGRHAPEIRELRAKMEREPCHRPTALSLANKLLDAGDSRGVLEHVDGFLKKCGDWHRLRWLSYSAHKQLSEFELAIADATRLIEDRPDDQDFWWWRGQAQEQLGRHDAALADYRQSHALMPGANYIPFDLSALLEKQGRPCEAITPVEIYLAHHAQHRESALVVSRLERLGGLCPDYAGTGLAALKVSDDGLARDGKAEIGDQRVPATINTSTPLTLIGQTTATRLSLPATGPKLRVGGRAGYLVMLSTLTVGRASARNVEAVVVPSSPEYDELIVGQSFLARFAYEDDGARLIIHPRGLK